MNKNKQRVDISACLEAVSHYDADYHRERGVEEYPQPEYVPRWEHFWTNLKKNSTRLLGQGCISLAWTAGVLFVANIIRNYCAYQAMPVLKPGQISPPWPDTSTPLPANYWAENVTLYFFLAALGYVSGRVGTYLVWQARKIKQTLPIFPADTASLPAVETLVRASAEPMQAQQAMLLRAATESRTRHEEQLVRASVSFSASRSGRPGQE